MKLPALILGQHLAVALVLLEHVQMHGMGGGGGNRTRGKCQEECDSTWEKTQSDHMPKGQYQKGQCWGQTYYSTMQMSGQGTSTLCPYAGFTGCVREKDLVSQNTGIQT